MNKTAIKIFGIIASILGIGGTLLADWVGEKKTEEMIEEKIKEALEEADRRETDDEEEL